VGNIEGMNATNPGDDHGQDDPTRPIPESSGWGFSEPDPDRSVYGEEPRGRHGYGHGGQGYGAPDYRGQYGGQGYGGQGYGGQGYGDRGYGQGTPAYGSYGHGDPSFGPSYAYGPTPPRPSHASGPLMTPGDGGFGHASPPPYVPPRRKQKRGKGGVALLLAAVVAGGLAGVGASAAYDALDEPESLPAAESLQGSQASDEADTAAPAGSVEAVANKVLPSVVKIDVSSGSAQGAGSGIILGSDGTILTNNHVVEVAEGGGDLAVSFNDGTTADATIVGTDPLTDIAVIKAQGVSGLRPAVLGDSGNVDVGEQVVAVGSPFGLESTVTSGIVSALHRPVSAGGTSGGESTVFPAIQTDAAINPGNSGGALVNMDGEVIGINTAIRSTTNLTGEAGSIGLGFAIPVDEAEPIAEQLVRGEAPTHARLGVTVATPTNGEGLPEGAVDEGLPNGAIVRSVEPGTAAAGVGLQRGDVITRVDDNIISSSDGLVATVRTYRPGDKVEVTFVRDGTQRQVSLTLGSDEGSSAN
jgi:putative serine protease PepD